MKKVLGHIFIDGVNGMALGVLVTYAFGTILQQIGSLLSAELKDYFISIGALLIILTGAGIAAGMASVFGAKPAVALAAMVSGMVGAHADSIYSSSLAIKETVVRIGGTGDMLCAFIAALIALEVGNLVAGKTEFDLLLTPLASIVSGCFTGMILQPTLSTGMEHLAQAFEWSTKQNSVLMGIFLASLACIFSLLPINLVTILGIANIHGSAAGAVTIGCCCCMIGYAFASYRDNKACGLFLQGIGTAKLQLANTFKKPYILLPALVSSAVLGGISTGIFNLTNGVRGAAAGATGLVGWSNAYEYAVDNMGSTEALILVSLLCFILPAVLSLGIAEGLRKAGLLKDGDMKIS